MQSAPLSSSPAPLPSAFTSTPAPASGSSPEADGKPTAPEENGEAELEPIRNGAGHTSETESSDSGATPGDKENSTGAPPDMEGEKDLSLCEQCFQMTQGKTEIQGAKDGVLHLQIKIFVFIFLYLELPLNEKLSTSVCFSYLFILFSPLLSSSILLGCPDLTEPSGKRQYNREFLLGFQFMPACIQKPEGLPPISDVVLDKVSYR